MRRVIRDWSHSMQITTPSFMVTASGWAPPMPPSPAVSVMVPASVPPKRLVGDGGERLERALQDALGADVDPRAGGHLAVHRQPEVLEPPELLPVGPVADQVGVGDQHPRRPLVGAHHADRLAALHEHRLVVARGRAGCAPGRRTPPSCARPCRCRRRRRGPRDARRSPGRGCSSASAAAPRSATTGRSARCRGRRGWAGAGSRWSCSSPITSSTASRTAPERTSATAVSISGDRCRSGPGPSTPASRSSRTTAAVAGDGSSGARRSSARAAVSTSIATTRVRPSTERRSLRAADQPIDTWSSCIALEGIESTDAGFGEPLELARRSRPGCTARSSGRCRRRGRRRGTAAARGCGTCRGTGRYAAR